MYFMFYMELVPPKMGILLYIHMHMFNTYLNKLIYDSGAQPIAGVIIKI